MRVNINIKRFNPENENKHYLQKFLVPKEKRSTVLEALLYIYEEIDSTLAFRFGCRFRKCGLCGVEVNGKPRLACLTILKDEMEIGALSRLPVIRDLIIDRRFLLNRIKELSLFIPEQKDESEPEIIEDNKLRKDLIGCIECLCCQSSCPHYDYNDLSFAGPYIFVKLAQLKLDPRNRIDRTLQDRKLGIDKCEKCKTCYCPIGIEIKGAIEILKKLGEGGLKGDVSE